jgi:hypothetical protein
VRDDRRFILVELDLLEHCLLDAEQTPPYLGSAHAVPLLVPEAVRQLGNVARKRRVTVGGP